MITTTQAETIFCNIDTIRSIHSHLLHLFLEEVKLPDYTPKIAADLEQVMVSSKGEYFTYMAGNEVTKLTSPQFILIGFYQHSKPAHAALRICSIL